MVYADNSATTKISTGVLDSMLPYLTQNYGNASSLYHLGEISKQAINKSRKQIADVINADANEIYFTSCGSESNNWSLKGIVTGDYKNCHIITSAFEHPSIANTCKDLENKGCNVTYIKPDNLGIISPEEVFRHITDKTKLVSIMYVNNEIGTIQPISEIAHYCREHNIIFHTDATQGIPHLKIDVKKDNIDLMSFSGHKFNAPKGVGVLYIRNGINISPSILGGEQEKSLRSGTENVAYIVGIGKAIQELQDNFEQYNTMVRTNRNYLYNLLSDIPDIRLNGSMFNRIDSNLNISIKDCEGQKLALMLDTAGICISTGSACSSESVDASPTLQAINVPDDYIYCSIRITLSKDNTLDEMHYISEVIHTKVEEIRREVNERRQGL